MIVHIVFWKFKENARGKSADENAAELKARLLALKNSIPEIVEISCGTDFNRSPVAYDFALYTLFKCKEDLQVYQDHPEHVKIKEFVPQIVIDRAVVDYIV